MIVRRRVFLSADWRHLVMLNYEIAPAALMPYVPRGTVLDLWDGRALISVVGLHFSQTRVMGVGFPLHRDFDEVNLRMYVRREMPDGPARRGAVFIREIVPRAAVALTARLTYNEPYRVMRMRSEIPVEPTDAPGRILYSWLLPAGWQHVAATAVGQGTIAAAGSESQFITEHYWGYTRQRDGGTIEYEVSHPKWRTWHAESPELTPGAAGFYGLPFSKLLSAKPCSAMIADGSAVAVYSPRRMGEGKEEGRRKKEEGDCLAY